MVYGRIPTTLLRHLAQRNMPETILIVRETTTYDPDGGEVAGDDAVVLETRGMYRTATAQEVANYQRMDERVDGEITVPVDAAPNIEAEYRLYRVEAGITYEIIGTRRATPQQESEIRIMVRQADPERSYEP